MEGKNTNTLENESQYLGSYKTLPHIILFVLIFIGLREKKFKILKN